MRHGGDVYRNDVRLDFSVNINPLGVPKSVADALNKAIERVERYPDIDSEELCSKLAKIHKIPAERIVCANGASELLLAVVHALKPRKILLPVPSFYGYERAACAAGAEIIYYEMREENDFCLDKTFLEKMTDGVDMVFLANPNNPTGRLTDDDLLLQIMEKARALGIWVILDECFLSFAPDGEQRSYINRLDEFKNLCVIRAFTKIYAMPGVRLGYACCADGKLLERLKIQIPEWSVSVFAQAAGAAACGETQYLKETADIVARERDYLKSELEGLGVRVYASDANFMLLKSGEDLYKMMLKNGILIRDCANYRGLGEGYYRIAVKKHEDNEALVSVLRKEGFSNAAGAYSAK